MTLLGTVTSCNAFQARTPDPPGRVGSRCRDGRTWLRWLFLGTTLTLAAESASGTVLYVPDPYPTIQAAVDAASNGDEIRVHPGTYSGEGNIMVNPLGRTIVIRSIAGPEVTTIDCQSAGSAFRFDTEETDQTRVEGFTIRNGLAQEGGGIYCGYASPVIRDCIFRDCRAVYGGGIQLNQSHARVEACQFFGCRAEGGTYGGSAGGLSAENGGALIIDCLFEGCSAHGIPAYGSGKGGGMWAGTAQIVRCRFQGNTADFLGGGLDADYTCQIEDCVFIGNRAGTGGGACLGVNVVATGCTFAANEALVGPQGDGKGGGITIFGNQADLRRCIVWGNCAAQGGDQIHSRTSGSSARLECCCTDPAGLSGNWVDAGQNVFEDPLFCDAWPCGGQPWLGSYALDGMSPCLPQHSPCGGRIGAFDQGCGVIPVLDTTWGAIKVRYSDPRR